ncbi:MAG: hypothetical protein PVG30_00030 [Gammaproteobacteria bacterium]
MFCCKKFKSKPYGEYEKIKGEEELTDKKDANISELPSVECTVDEIVKILDTIKSLVNKITVGATVGVFFTSKWGLDCLINKSKWNWFGPLIGVKGLSLAYDSLVFAFSDLPRLLLRCCGPNVENGCCENAPKWFSNFFSSKKTTGELIRTTSDRIYGMVESSVALFAMIWSIATGGEAAPPKKWANAPYFITSGAMSAAHNFFSMVTQLTNDTKSCCCPDKKIQIQYVCFDKCFEIFDVEGKPKELDEFKCKCKPIFEKIWKVVVQKGLSITAALSLCTGLSLVIAASYYKEGTAMHDKLMNWAMGIFVGATVSYGLALGADVTALMFRKCCKSECMEKAKKGFDPSRPDIEIESDDSQKISDEEIDEKVEEVKQEEKSSLIMEQDEKKEKKTESDKEGTSPVSVPKIGSLNN